MTKTMQTMRWLVLVSGILLITLGFFMMGRPVSTLVGLSVYMGISLILSGIVEIISYFAHDKAVRSGWLLANGGMTLFLGWWLLFSDNGTQTFIIMLTILFPIWLLATSIMMAVNALDLRKSDYPNWWLTLLIGILGTIGGFLLMFAPITTALTLSFSLAVIVIYRGIEDIIFFITTRKHKSDQV